MLVDAAAALTRANKMVQQLTLRVAELESVLHLIAAPKRSDGTYNRCREACEILAREALKPK